jgi:hypothetical protein
MEPLLNYVITADVTFGAIKYIVVVQIEEPSLERAVDSGYIRIKALCPHCTVKLYSAIETNQ